MPFLFLFINWKPTMWPANYCLQIMVCLCSAYALIILSNVFCCTNEVLLTCIIVTRCLSELSESDLNMKRNFKLVMQWLSKQLIYWTQLSRMSDVLEIFLSALKERNIPRNSYSVHVRYRPGKKKWVQIYAVHIMVAVFIVWDSL